MASVVTAESLSTSKSDLHVTVPMQLSDDMKAVYSCYINDLEKSLTSLGAKKRKYE